MELSQEYFDKGITNILEHINTITADMATKADIQAIRAEMATKEDLKNAVAPLATNKYVTESFETLQIWMDERFKELIVRYDMRERVEKLEKEFKDFKLKKPAHV